MHSFTIRNFLVFVLFFFGALKQLDAQVRTFPAFQKVCKNTSAVILVQNVTDTDAVFRWQDSTSTGWNNIVPGVNYAGVANDTLFIFNINALFHNRKYRCIIDSAGVGTSFDTIGVSRIHVRPDLIKAQLSNSQNICFGSIPDTIRVISHPLGADSGFSYQWQFSLNGTTWINLVNPQQNYLAVDTLSRSMYFRLRNTSLANCGAVNSDSVYIRINNVLLKPKLILKKQVVCYQSNPDSIRISNGNALYTYQWQISTDSINFVNLVNDTNVIKSSIQLLTSKRYYRLVATHRFNCGVLFSDTAMVDVHSPLIKPTISGTQTVCFNVTPDTLRIRPHVSTKNVKFQWQSSVNGIVWIDVPAANDTFLVLNSQGSTRFFRVKATWPRSCGIVYTDSVLVSVYNQFLPGVIKSNQSICYGYLPGLLSFQTLPSGGGDVYDYQWQVSTDSIVFVNIPGATTFIYQPDFSTSTKFYRIRVQSSQNCGVLFSNVIKVRVYQQFIGPQITASDTICYNTSTDTLRIVVPATGGSGAYTYQWQQSFNGLLWQNINGQTSPKYRPTSLITSTYFRLITSALPSCGVDTSNELFIKVWPKLVKPRITAFQNICFNTKADTLRVTQFAQGGNGLFIYQWQESLNGTSWTDILNQNGLKFSPGILTTTKFYRIKAISVFGCSFVTSDSIKINVYGDLSGGLIQQAQTICYDSIPQKLLYLTRPSGGGGVYSYQWQSSADSINFTNISGATLDNYQPPQLTSTRFYRVLVTSTFGCGTRSSNITKVKVYEKFIGATIGDSYQVCYGYIPIPLYMTKKPSGGSKNYIYQWQKSIDSTSWIDIVGQTSEVLPMTQNLQTTYFRLINASTESCGIDTSNVVTILTLKLPDSTNVLGLSSVCRNQQELFYRLENKSSLYTYEWIISKGEILTNINNHAVFITWNNEIGTDTIYVKQTNKITGCFNYMKLPIQLEEQMAPSKTEIMRKSTTNILVCKDTATGINYQWGYVDRTTSEYYDIPGANLRYVQLPHTFDTTKYLYFVKTWFSSCVTTTYMSGSDLSIGISNSTNHELKIYPNPSTGEVYVEYPLSSSTLIECYNYIGELQSIDWDIEKNKIIFNNKISPGLYIIKITDQEQVHTAKVILKR